LLVGSIPFVWERKEFSDEIGAEFGQATRLYAAQAPVARRDFVTSPVTVQQWDGTIHAAKMAAHDRGEVAEICLLVRDQFEKLVVGVDKFRQVFR